MLVNHFLENSARRFPGKTALVAGGNRLTYRDLDKAANRVARALRENGVDYGDRVAVLMDNTAEAAVAIWGVLKAGAVFLVINPTTKARKVEYILNNCRASALLTHRARFRIALPCVAATPSLKLVVAAGGETPEPPEGTSARFMAWPDETTTISADPFVSEAIDIDLASLIYTSGTTGNPKGVMLTHRNMVSASTSITTYLRNTEHDIVLSVLPLSFDYGLYQVLMAAQFGGTVVLEKSFAYPYAIIERLQQEKATGFPIVPTMSAILLQMKEIDPGIFDGIRYISNTAAALPEKHIRELRKIFRNADIYSMYGLTECKRVTYLPPEDINRKPGSVGTGMPNEQVYLVDDSGDRITRPDVTGELVVRGANVMQGYWELPDETAERLKPGRFPWEKVLYTGDLFRMDGDGYLYFVSRRDDIIKSRGEKVSPKEIECVLCEHEEIAEAAVVGEPDEVLGEAIKAYVVLEKDSRLSEREILGYCSRNLEDFMKPQIVVVCDSLPRTTSGKITKKDL
jgi:amino acid adenylation domain-containing protein